MAEQLARTQDTGATLEENQVVTFFLGDEEFGFDIMSVQEIIRQPVLCRIPMAPDYVEGIANLRGTVLPIIDTRRRFGMTRQEDTDGTRVLVLDVDGHKTGLRVDRVRQVTRIQAGEMEAPPAVIRGGGTSGYLEGVAKLDGGKRIIMALDPRAICKMQLVGVGDVASADGGAGARSEAVAEAATAEAIAQLVSFTLGEEEFAFSMDQVREILRVERPNEVPDTPDYVLGIVTVRGNILPVIDLRILLSLRTLDAEVTAAAARVRERFRGWYEGVASLAKTSQVKSGGLQGLEELRGWLSAFATSSQALMDILSQVRVAADHVSRGMLQAQGLAHGAPAHFERSVAPFAADVLRLMGAFEGKVAESISEDQRLIVVQSHGTLLALLVDRVREVLNVSKRLIDPPPKLSNADTSEMAGVARLDDGKRLIMLLDADHLVRGEALAALESQHAIDDDAREARGGTAMDRHASDEAGHALAERQFVTFRLGDGEYGIPIEQIQEIDRTSKMTRIPKSADYVDGITNLRGEVIPVINARKRFGLPTREVDEQTRVIILEIDGNKTGLLVDSVRQVLNQARRDIAPPPASIAGSIERQFISGIGKADDGKRMIVLLDVARVLAD